MHLAGITDTAVPYLTDWSTGAWVASFVLLALAVIGIAGATLTLLAVASRVDDFDSGRRALAGLVIGLFGIGVGIASWLGLGLVFYDIARHLPSGWLTVLLGASVIGPLALAAASLMDMLDAPFERRPLLLIVGPGLPVIVAIVADEVNRLAAWIPISVAGLLAVAAGGALIAANQR